MPPTQSRVHSPATSAFLRRNQAVLYTGLILAVLAVTLTAVLAVRHFHQEAEARFAVTTQNMALSLDRTIEVAIVVGLAALFILASAAFAWAMTRYVALKTDISERKRIEHALRAESEKSLVLLRNASDGIHILDTDGNVIEASDSFCAMLGYTRDEVLGMNLAQWDVGLSPDELRQALARQLERPVRTQFETHHRRKDGSVFAVEISGFPLELDGRPVLFNSSRDISARKQTEEHLRDSEQRFRLFFERNSLVMLLIDPASGEIIAANAAAAAYYGYPQAHLVGMSINQINTLPPERIHAERQKALHEDRNYFLFPHRLASGEVRDVEVYSTPIHDGGRDLLLSIVHDITERNQAQQRLEHVLAEQKAMLENELIGIVKVKNREIVWANPAFEQMLGYGPGELNGAPTRQNYPSATAYEEFGAAAYPALSAGKIYRTRFEQVRKDGQLIWLEVSGGMLNQAEGESLWGFIDVTERKATEVQIQLAASVFEHAREGIIITDSEAAIIDVNRAFTRITGYSHDEVLGRNPHLLSSGRHDPAYYAAMWRDLKAKGHWSGEIWNRRKNGEVFAELLTISSVRDTVDETQQYVAMFSDITLLKEHEQQLEFIAHYDALTHLPNRVLLTDRLHQAMAQSQRRGLQLAVAFIDLDGFKGINDQHGHEVGDQVLISVAARMKNSLREIDTCARLGGDEFVAVLVDLSDEESIHDTLARLLAAAAQPIQIGELTLQVSASIGVTLYPQQVIVDAEELLRQADQAMYQAKQAGKNRYRIFEAG